MTERFNVPPGWPVPSDWTPPQGWEPDPAWPAAPAGWQFWVDDIAEQSTGSLSETQRQPVMPNLSELPPPQQDSSVGKRLVILGAVGAVLLVALVGVVVMFLHYGGNDAALNSPARSVEAPAEAWKTLPSTAPAVVPTVLPPGAVVCGIRPGGRYQGAARGTETTSCPFVENVRDALNNAGGQVPSVVDAYSPVTGLHYAMSCAMEQVVTCRGGKNAVVYVYDPAATSAPAASAPATGALPSDAMIFEALKRSGVSAHDLARYAIVSKAAPTAGWYVAEIRRTDMQLEHAHAIFRDNAPPDGHLMTVAGPGTSFPGLSVPDEVRRALPAGMIP